MFSSCKFDCLQYESHHYYFEVFYLSHITLGREKCNLTINVSVCDGRGRQTTLHYWEIDIYCWEINTRLNIFPC